MSLFALLTVIQNYARYLARDQGNGMRAAIVESDLQARARLRRFVERLDGGAFDVVSEYAKLDELTSSDTQCGLDVLFVDIEQRSSAGYEALERWHSSRLKIVLVGLSARSGFRTLGPHATVYTLQPIPAQQLRENLEQSIGAVPLTPFRRLALPIGQRTRLVPACQIDVVLAQGNYLEINAAGAKYMIRSTLADFHARLETESFVRLHRSALVRIEAIHEVKPIGSGRFRVRLHGGYTFQSGRSFRDKVHNLIGMDCV